MKYLAENQLLTIGWVTALWTVFSRDAIFRILLFFLPFCVILPRIFFTLATPPKTKMQNSMWKIGLGGVGALLIAKAIQVVASPKVETHDWTSQVKMVIEQLRQTEPETFKLKENDDDIVKLTGYIKNDDIKGHKANLRVVFQIDKKVFVIDGHRAKTVSNSQTWEQTLEFRPIVFEMPTILESIEENYVFQTNESIALPPKECNIHLLQMNNTTVGDEKILYSSITEGGRKLEVCFAERDSKNSFLKKIQYIAVSSSEAPIPNIEELRKKWLLYWMPLVGDVFPQLANVKPEKLQM
jgi:hypothetical protein